MEFKKLSQQDIEEVKAIQPEDWQDIVPAITFYIQSDFCLAIQMRNRNQMLGIGALIFHEDTAWLAHIIVHPEFRNQGIGRSITSELIRLAYQKGIQSLNLIATNLGERVYTKLGFETETEYLFYRNMQPFEMEYSEKNIQAIGPLHLPMLAKMDLEIFGEDRSALLAPHLKEGFVYEVGNKMLGYYLPGLGEGLIAAGSPEAGLALMAYRFQTKTQAAFPIDNKEARDYMQALGHAPFKQAKRMYLGKRRNWQAENVYNRIGGNLG